jgi:hypothetical protein
MTEVASRLRFGYNTPSAIHNCPLRSRVGGCPLFLLRSRSPDTLERKRTERAFVEYQSRDHRAGKRRARAVEGGECEVRPGGLLRPAVPMKRRDIRICWRVRPPGHAARDLPAPVAAHVRRDLDDEGGPAFDAGSDGRLELLQGREVVGGDRVPLPAGTLEHRAGVHEADVAIACHHAPLFYGGTSLFTIPATFSPRAAWASGSK